MTSTSDIASLEALGTDQRLRELGSFVPPLGLFRALGLRRSELAHSDLIAALLDPRACPFAEPMLRALLENASVAATASAAAAGKRLAVLASAGTLHPVRIRREFLHIDILIEIGPPGEELVVALENKLDAGEQPQQIANYQEALRRAFPGRSHVLLFLSPNGRCPQTAAADSPVPVIALPYGALVASCSSVIGQFGPRSRERRVLEEFVSHIQEDILSEDPVVDRVQALWKSHPRALALALQHRPRLAQIDIAYRQALPQILRTEVDFGEYRPRGDLREIHATLLSWKRLGFPFTFMLYADRYGLSNVRVLVYDDEFAPVSAQLQDWARRANAACGTTVFDEAFAPIKDWKCWRRVLSETDYPLDSELRAQAFDQDTIDEAVVRVNRLVDLILPHVESHPKPA